MGAVLNLPLLFCSPDYDCLREHKELAALEKPDAELQMKPMVLERVLRIENFY